MRTHKNKKAPEDKLPPHSEEMERGVLSCCLLAPEGLNVCEERSVQAAWFYDLRHQVIFEAMMGLHTKGEIADLIALYTRLKQCNQAEDVGGLNYLTEVQAVAPSAANLDYYLDVLHEHFLLRSTLQICQRTSDAALTLEGEVQPFLSGFEAEVLQLCEGADAKKETTLRQVTARVLEDMEEYHRGRAQIVGVTTGLEYVDKILCGMGGEHGNYVVLSGRPATGKTSLALQWAIHAARDYVWWQPILDGEGKPQMELVEGREVYKCARKQGVQVGIFSLEMASKALVQRMLFARAQADLQRWRTGYAQGEDQVRLARAALEFATPDNVRLDDEGCYTIEKLRAKARRWWRQGCKFFVIDYLQLLHSERRFEGRVQEMEYISGSIRKLAKQLNVPFIVLAQMNRDYEKDSSRPPRLSDLKDCGSIEQDADVVGFLYSPKLSEKEGEKYDAAMEKVFPGADWSQRPKRVNLIFQKNRYGMTGPCQLLFQKSCTRFFDWNVWLKEHGEKEMAMGERPVERDMPSNEELGME